MASVVTGKIGRLATAFLLAVLAFSAAAEEDEVATAAIKGSAKAEQPGALCVRPTEWMRRNHMELVKHQRDLTVRQGVRVGKDSLANCVDCHVRKDANHQPVAINAEGQFCDSCHDYAAVNLTCFQCHSTVPSTETAKR
jgi:hypothetical protein